MLLYFTFRILPESPRWLLANGNINKALPILKNAAKMNGKDVKDLESQVDTLVKLTFKVIKSCILVKNLINVNSLMKINFVIQTIRYKQQFSFESQLCYQNRFFIF